MNRFLHKLNLRKVVSAAEAAKTPEERWRLISGGITFEGSMMLKASLQPEIKLTNTEMDVLTSWQDVCSDAFNDELYGSADRVLFMTIERRKDKAGQEKH